MSFNPSKSSFQRNFLNPEWLKRLLKAFPLPMPEDDECRDQFLANIFASFTPPMMITPSDSSSSSMTIFSQKSKGVTFRSTMIEHTLDYEEKLLGAMMTHSDHRPSVTSRSTFTSSRSRDSVATINIKKVMLSRLDNTAQLLSVLAILYALHNLQAKLHMLRNVWNPHATYDKTLRMFSWSLKNYYARFHHKNVVYCETFVMEVGDQMECIKYRKDLSEMIRLLSLLIQDVEKMRDICDHSMKAIKDAQTDMFDLLTESEQQVHQEYEEIMLESLKRPVARCTSRPSITKMISVECVEPIEARYKINWTKTRLDQAEMFDRRKCEEMIRELAWLKAETIENSLTWDTSRMAYNIQNSGLKQRIFDLEFLYEDAMFNMDLKIDATKAKLSKAKDDLQFHKDQIPIFHEKIAKTQNIIAQRELMGRRASRKSVRTSLGNSKTQSTLQLQKPETNKTVKNKKKK